MAARLVEAMNRLRVLWHTEDPTRTDTDDGHVPGSESSMPLGKQAIRLDDLLRHPFEAPLHLAIDLGGNNHVDLTVRLAEGIRVEPKLRLVLKPPIQLVGRK